MNMLIKIKMLYLRKNNVCFHNKKIDMCVFPNQFSPTYSYKYYIDDVLFLVARFK